ncbi:DUF4194 domain-containing protein [Verrucomicrobiaceae bacterium N1E253]|uniref:DUF4194 domain-containing protein n=1 Tax=Oceaniferula marina TaxID=2748318 RepID=A0A851GIP4_9BACT|nr:DUF4194 domain-containing protein [Oceaniferula marina]NWK54997.1 DUF4194 domain-containing protein [Oceaniferula marina]
MADAPPQAPTQDAFESEQAEPLINLPEHDRERLGEAIQQLLASGSISGHRSDTLYHWCRQHLEPLKEYATVAGLDIAMFHDERLIQAIPHVSSLRLRLRKDETIVWLALWYAGDIRWRDEGNDQAFLSVSELNALIQDQLLPDLSGQIAQGRLREILRKAVRFNLIKMESSDPFEESGIEVLPAIRRAVPFHDLTEWCELARDFNPQDAKHPDELPENPLDEEPMETIEDEPSDEAATNETSSADPQP